MDMKECSRTFAITYAKPVVKFSKRSITYMHMVTADIKVANRKRYIPCRGGSKRDRDGEGGFSVSGLPLPETKF